MIVLQVSHAKKSYDTVDVLHDASLIIRAGDKVGLVGPNGAGKSTLVRIATGEETADSGQITVKSGVTIGYVSQFIDIDGDTTLYAFVAEAKAYLREMEQQLRRLEQQMAKPEVYENPTRFEATSTQYDHLSRTFSDEGGYAWQTDIRRVLTGLQFPTEMHETPIQSLSGGQKTRLSLARLLAMAPTLLVLDEPTNYLDTDTLTWLESYLKNYDGSLLVVSHDRYFLDEITNQTVEVENGVTTSYVGNYERYVEQKLEARLQQAKAYAHQQEEIAKLETFVEKNLARASTTKRAQSRRKWLLRMDRIDQPEGDRARVHLGLTVERPSGRDVLMVEDLAVGYSEHVLAKNIQFRLERGMRLAILGKNGMGKTTLMKTLLSQLPPIGGAFRIGQHVNIAYYDQEQSNLDKTKTVLSQVWDEHPLMDMSSIRGVLAQFLFRGEDVDKPVAGLSGGERSRLSLCRLMLLRANTLFMDEPTNHLDIPSKEALEDSLLDYDGTLLFISHDRYFIDAVATHVGVLDADGLSMYIGNYTEYRAKVAENERIQAIAEAELARQQSENASATGKRAQTQSTNIPSRSGGSGGLSGHEAEGGARRRIRSSDIRKAREAVVKWERTAADCESELAEIALQMSEAAQAQDVDLIYALDERHKALETQQTEAITFWETALIELEALEQEAERLGE